MDIVGFMNRIGVSNKTKFAKMLDTKPQNINKWFNKSQKEPTYEMCKKLLKIGMTLEELFDKETAEAYEANRQQLPEDQKLEFFKNIDFSDPVMQKVLAQVLSEKLVIGFK